MSENAASPKRGLFQSLSKRVSGYRNKKKDDPSSPRSQASETTSESQREQFAFLNTSSTSEPWNPGGTQQEGCSPTGIVLLQEVWMMWTC